MSTSKRWVAAVVLPLFLCVSVSGQQPMTPQQIRHVRKVANSLARYDTGTRLDVLLNDGNHQIGTLSQTGPATFVLVEAATLKPLTIEYLDVKRIQAQQSRSQQRGTFASVFTVYAVCVAAFATVALVLFVKNGDR